MVDLLIEWARQVGDWVSDWVMVETVSEWASEWAMIVWFTDWLTD